MNLHLSCPHFPACGGCQILDLPYHEQLEAKAEELQRFFSEWLKPDAGLELRPVLPSPKVEGYRHKVQLPFGIKSLKGAKGRGAEEFATIGCYGAGSHVVVDQDECMVQEPGLSRVAWAVRDWATEHKVPVYREATGEGWLRHLLLRRGAGTGEVLLGLVTNGPGAGPQALLPALLDRCREALAVEGGELVGIVQSLNTEKTNVVLGGEERLWWGRAHLREQLGPFAFHVGISTFFQVNPFQTPRLYDLAVEAIPAGADVLDLYSGIGSIALWASRGARSVLGIEENAASVEAARRATLDNAVANVEFIAADVARALTDLAAHGTIGEKRRTFQAAIVDPPRKGLEPAVRDALVSLGLEKIVYVSCYPATLARDARALSGAFRLKSLAPVDMFPHTRHVECVAVFERA